MPTKNGIQYYVSTNADKIVKQVQEFIGDTIYSYSINVDDLSLYNDYDSLEAGRFYPDDEILVTNELKYCDYELKFLPRWKQKTYSNNNKFVKTVIIHELVHLYVYQFINDNREKYDFYPDYLNFTVIRTNSFTATFIEEGLCEYVVNKMNESINDFHYAPTCIDEIRNPENKSTILYVYASTFLKPFADTLDFKEMLIKILCNKPPSYEELLKPKDYYRRISC